ncbi:MAG: alcohol dehydrogenase catalytic domain-containing protein [Anaerolineae bacterium]|nr:alcohol dehydrogenase catalytic domain-containing protein [Anaerolineae bacterium]
MMGPNASHGDAKLAAYRRADVALPKRYKLWPLYGSGLENLGRDGQPIEVTMPTCGPDQLLVRHDAVGLCFSDTKVIQAGETHPRLTGRDMKANPVVLGHEVALTVVQAGAHYADRFKAGERFIVQADIYYQGVGLAYGYALQGGLSQYNLIGQEILDGDEGCYLLPVEPETGYAQAALTEPWACVLASYEVAYRAGWGPEGRVLIAAGPSALESYTMGTPYAGGQPPAEVVTLGVGGPLMEELRRRAEADGYVLLQAASVGELGDAAFDDLVLLGADTALFEALQPRAARGALINLVGAQGFSGPAQVDVGRLHYDLIALLSTPESDLSLAYEPIRTELLPGGAAAFLGAAGPMGQMHVQRALQSPESPRLIMATDLVADRLAVLATKYAQLIERKSDKTHLELRVPGDESPQAFNAGLLQATGGVGYDDIVVLAPSARVVSGAVELLARDGVMNIFAGLPRGSMALIDLGLVVNKSLRFTGTSGSAIRDLRTMLNAAESGRLDPNLSVAAISGLGGVKQGLEGVIHQAFPGKVVIYPQIEDFPLTRLSDLAEVLPQVYAKLGPNESWTVAAEAEFLKEMLP